MKVSNCKILMASGLAVVLSLSLILSTVPRGSYYQSDLVGSLTYSKAYAIGDTLDRAKKKDTVHLSLHSTGGVIYIGYDIINSLRSTEAKTTGTIKKMCYSMCAMISLELDKLLILPNAKIMFHYYHYGGITALPGSYLAKLDPSSQRYFTATFKNMKRIGLLTDIEFRGIMKGYDIYIDGKTYAKRLERIGK